MDHGQSQSQHGADGPDAGHLKHSIEVTDAPIFLSRIVGRKAAESVNRRRRAILLAALVVLVLAAPIAEVTSQAQFILIGATVGFLLACLQQVGVHSRLRLSSRLMVLLWLILNLPLPWFDGAWVQSAAAATLAALILCILWLAAQHLISADRIDAELLCGAFGAYLLLGVFWAETYKIIDFAAPAAFTKPDGGPPSPSALFYFSFTTLTTTGYGDITAINPVVRIWSIFEAIIGTMYNATVIARLVSLYGSHVERRDR